MSQEEILSAAKEAGLQLSINAEAYPVITQQIERFAAIIERKTIERCAVALDRVMVTDHSLNTFKRCQAAIRKLGEE